MVLHVKIGVIEFMRISLFITCFNDTLYPDTGKAMVQLLERLGHSVEFPREQTCCGQMHYNSGYHDEVIPLVRKFIHVFKDAEIVVAPSASCVAMVREFYSEVAKRSGDQELIKQVEQLVTKVHELSVFLVEILGIEDVGAYYPHRVTYHPTCHSMRMLHVGDAPLKLLRKVRGIELVSLTDADQCCGFGGTFALKNFDTSVAMAADKVMHINECKAEVCTSIDNSCLMHIGGTLERQGSAIKSIHLAEILASTFEEHSVVSEHTSTI